MRVDNQGLQIIQARIANAVQLIEGSMIKAQVIEQSREQITLQFKQQQIEAKIQGNVGNLQGRSVSFLVVSNNQDEILLKPIPESEAQNISSQTTSSGRVNEGSLNAMLRRMGLENDPRALNIVQDMLRLGLPVDDSTVNEIMQTTQQMENLLTLKEDTNVFLARESIQDVLQNLKGQDIPRFVESALANTDSPIAKAVNMAVRSGIPSSRIAEAISSSTTPMELAEKLRELMPESDVLRLSERMEASSTNQDRSLSKAPIGQLIVSEEEVMGELREISKEVKEFLPKFSEEGFKVLKEDLPKIVSFFKKYEIPNTLGNMKQMLEYVDKPDNFVKDLKAFNEVLKVIPEVFDEIVEEKNISKVLENITKNLSEPKVQSALERLMPDGKNADTILQKIDFLADMNKNLSFMPFPLNAEALKREGFINLVDEHGKKKVDYKKNLNIMIQVDTHHMGNIKVFCRLHQKNLKVRLSIKEDDLRFFNLGIEGLKKKINDLGYDLDDIEFAFDKRMTILDLPMDPELPNYFLDMRI